MKTKNQKIYKLICKTFGHKFSFNASNDEEAQGKLREWCAYHSHNTVDYKVEETLEEKWMHNEYFN